MTDDISNNESQQPSDPVEALKLLAASPQRWANTQALSWPTSIGVSSQQITHFSPAITGTTLVDVRALAERMMFDATVLVSRLDTTDLEFDLDREDRALERAQDRALDTVSVARVLKGGAAATGAFALVCIVGNRLAGTTLLHPLLAWSLILMSLGFYLMGRVKH